MRINQWLWLSYQLDRGSGGWDDNDGHRRRDREAIPATDASVLAWECAVGYFCAWTGSQLNQLPMRWANADNDWWNSPVACSWASATPVQSYLNNGTSPNFTGVNIFQGAQLHQQVHCVLQHGQGWNVTTGGVFLRSHRWTSGTCG